MPTRTPINVPNLVGVRADQAIQTLRELGLLPIMWAAAVKDVNQAGVVLGHDPPAGSQLRPRAFVAINVATHPDFQGHSGDSLPEKTNGRAELPVTGPETGGRCAPSPVERRDDLAQVKHLGSQQMRLW